MHALLEHTHAIHLDAASQAGPSAATNLVAADVEKVVDVLPSLHEIWSGFITIAVASYVLYLRAGLCFLCPLAMAVIYLNALPFVSGNVGPAMAAWSAKTDKRVGLTSSIFRGIQTVKSCAWDKLAFTMIAQARRTEGKQFRAFQRQLVKINVFTNVLQQALALSVILPLALVAHFKPNSGYIFDLNTAFTVLTAVSLLQQPLFAIGQHFSSVMIAIASLRRVQAFLESPVRVDPRSPLEAGVDGTILRLSNVTLSRGVDSTKPILSSVSLSFPTASISVITGPTGSGKSSLLLALMGELTPRTGLIETIVTRQYAGSKFPRVAYASQKPWIMESSSLSQNVLCGRTLDKDWYDNVLESCAIIGDSAFDLNASSMTNLSGGQRQRISLARCLYGIKDADVVLIDDSFSALDAVTETKIVQSLVQLQQHFGFALICVTESGLLIDRASYLVELGKGSINYKGPVLATRQRRFKTVQTRESDAITALKVPATGRTQIASGAAGAKTADDKGEGDHQNDTNRSAGLATFMLWTRAGGPFAVVSMLVCFILYVLL